MLIHKVKIKIMNLYIPSNLARLYKEKERMKIIVVNITNN